jgi:hypothetical protein
MKVVQVEEIYSYSAHRKRSMGHEVALWLRHTTQAGRLRIRECIFFSIYLILPGALDLGVYSAPNRNEYQKQKNNVSREKSAAVV